ncbi:hypothetical protein LTR53_014650, partial [Teratosphaeriaceae sp. CCFEE 6253]
DGPRLPAINISGFPATDFFANPADNPNGFLVNGTLPTNAAQGVHSLTDVPVFAMGPCQETFGGVYNSIDVFFHIAACLGLSQPNGPPSAGNSTSGETGQGGHYGGPGNWGKAHQGVPGYHHYGEQAPRYGGQGPWRE